MPLADAIQGDLHTGQLITWYYTGTTTPKPLTGATITGTITDRVTGITRAVAGVLTVTDEPNGVFSWAYAAADPVTAGTFTVQFTATYADGLPDSSFETPWNVLVKR